MAAKPKPTTQPALPIGDLSIQYRSLRSLVPYARNSRTHSPEQIEQIKRSLMRFGWTTPMVVAGDTMIAGHARLAASVALAEAEQPIPRNSDPWTGPVVDVSHLSPQDQRAYVIADNQLAQNAGWDRGLLRIELNELKFEEFDLSLLGFDNTELDKLMAEVTAPSSFPSFDETIPVEHRCPRCGYVFSGSSSAVKPGEAQDDNAPDLD